MSADYKRVALTVTAAGMMIAAAGCAPRMAETELSAEEEQWAAYIGDKYSAWERPQTIPSGVRRSDISENTVIRVDEATGETTGVTKETAVTGYGETTVVSRVTEAPQPEAAPAVPAEVPAAVPDSATATEEAGEAVTAEAGEKAAEAQAQEAKSPEVKAPEVAAPAEPVIYTVQKGDSLSAIALKHYGKASAWTKIQKANEDVLKGKTVIRPGMKLVLPKL